MAISTTSRVTGKKAEPIARDYQSTVSQTTALVKRTTRRNKRRLVRYGLIIGNVLIVGALAIFMLSNQSTGQSVKTTALNSSVGTVDVQNPLDQLGGADIAVHVARMAGLEEATTVVNQADDVATELYITESSNQVVAKPQVISSTIKSKSDIQKYVAVSGDTVSTLATRFGVTSETIKWSNGLTGDSIGVGTQLWISPVNGILHVVKAGDTPDNLAQKFRANKDQIIAFNDAEIAGLKVGDRIVIPEGSIAPTNTSRAAYGGGGFAFGSAAQYGSNGYTYGWCTWHAANRRAQIGRPIPSNLGNAISWASRARLAGLGVGPQPAAGAVIYHRNLGGLGHVAFVESVNGDGTLTVSDMNYPSWGRVTYRTVPPSEFGNYLFIY